MCVCAGPVSGESPRASLLGIVAALWTGFLRATSGTTYGDATHRVQFAVFQSWCRCIGVRVTTTGAPEAAPAQWITVGVMDGVGDMLVTLRRAGVYNETEDNAANGHMRGWLECFAETLVERLKALAAAQNATAALENSVYAVLERLLALNHTTVELLLPDLWTLLWLHGRRVPRGAQTLARRIVHVYHTLRQMDYIVTSIVEGATQWHATVSARTYSPRQAPVSTALLHALAEAFRALPEGQILPLWYEYCV